MPSSSQAPTAAWATRRWISPGPSDVDLALDTAVRFLGQRPRSEYEIRQRLRRARSHFDEAVVETVLERLRQARLVDDQAFAEYWVEQRQTFRPRGARLLRAELARLGVARSVGDEATVAVERDAEGDAYRAAGKHARQLRDADEAAFKARMSAWLARRGFSWDVAGPVVERLWAEMVEAREDR